MIETPQRAEYPRRSRPTAPRTPVDGNTWTCDGEQERATITFSDDGHTQTHHWEYRPEGDWITLCDRVATRID